MAEAKNMVGSRGVGRLAPWAAVLLILTGSGCMGVRGKKHTYSPTGGTVEVAGADLGIEFRPEGTKGPSVMMSAMVVGGGFATFDGPFRWRLEGIGEAGRHESLVVHRIRTRTEITQREGAYPAEHLGFAKRFRPLKGQPGKVRVRYEIPGLLRVKPSEDGKLAVWIDLSVKTVSGATRRTLHFEMDPTTKRADQMLFIPAEIVRGIGTDFEDHEDPMWD